MSFSIAGKTAIVTGSANGIGLAIGKHFVDRGANVMFADVDETALEREFGASPENDQIRYFAGDLREKLTIANLLSATLDNFERVDILINASRQVIASDPLNPDDEAVETGKDEGAKKPGVSKKDEEEIQGLLEKPVLDRMKASRRDAQR